MDCLFEKFNSNKKIIYNGFSPNQNQKRLALDGANHLLMLSPSGAFIKCSYYRINNSFYGRCDVTSKAGKFSAKSSADSFEECVRLLKEDMISRLNSWKQLRFFKAASESEYFDRVG